MALVDDLTPQDIEDQVAGRADAEKHADPNPTASTMYYRAYVEATLLRAWRKNEQTRAL